MMIHGTSSDMQRDMRLVYQKWKADPALQRRLFLMWWSPLAQPIGGSDPHTGNWGTVGGKFIGTYQRMVDATSPGKHNAWMILPGDDLSSLDQRSKVTFTDLHDLTRHALDMNLDVGAPPPAPLSKFNEIYERAVPFGRFRMVPELWKVARRYTLQKTREQREYILEKTIEKVASLDCPDKREHGKTYIKFMRQALDSGHEYLLAEMRRLNELQLDSQQLPKFRVTMMGRTSVLKSFLTEAPQNHDWKAYKQKNEDVNNRGFSFDQSTHAGDESYFYN